MSDRDVLAPVLRTELFYTDPRLLIAFNGEFPAPAALFRRTKDASEIQIQRGWRALFAKPSLDLGRYRVRYRTYSKNPVV